MTPVHENWSTYKVVDVKTAKCNHVVSAAIVFFVVELFGGFAARTSVIAMLR